MGYLPHANIVFSNSFVLHGTGLKRMIDARVAIFLSCEYIFLPYNFFPQWGLVQRETDVSGTLLRCEWECLEMRVGLLGCEWVCVEM